MSKPKRLRWVCPECGTGRLGPSQLSPLDVRRFCMPCSAKLDKGPLVGLTCPALDAKRKAKAETRAERTRRQNARQAVLRASTRNAAKDAEFVQGVHVRTEAIRQINKSATLARLRRRPPEVRVSWRNGYGAAGRGAPWYGVTIYGNRNGSSVCVKVTILHELIHVLVGGRSSKSGRRLEWHGEEFKRAYAKAAGEVFGVDVGWAGKVDDEITRQLQDREQA